MDYKLLLKKYINHVNDEEGVSFIRNIIVGVKYSKYPITKKRARRIRTLRCRDSFRKCRPAKG